MIDFRVRTKICILKIKLSVYGKTSTYTDIFSHGLLSLVNLVGNITKMYNIIVYFIAINKMRATADELFSFKITRH